MQLFNCPLHLGESIEPFVLICPKLIDMLILQDVGHLSSSVLKQYLHKICKPIL